MFAINHAAAALLVKRRYPDVSLVPILVGVQAMELLWVALNYAGIERTSTEPAVRYVGDIHLTYMPYSHSIATMLGVAAMTSVLGALASRSRLGAAFGLAVASHLVLDLATHDRDIALAPLLDGAKYGTQLYGRLPVGAFLLELGFGLLCWWVYRGGRALLAVIVGFNLANLSLFFPAVPGVERWLVGRSILLTTTILVQILVTLFAVWWAALPGSNAARIDQGGATALPATTDLVWPAREYLPGYVDALERGWSPDSLRPQTALDHLARIVQDPDGFLAELVDREAKGPPVLLPDGTSVPRLPGYSMWIWDGEFCGSIGFRWQPGTAELPAYCLGHIGYSVVPWKQRRGHATRALQLLLPRARAEGLEYVELTTDADNVASRRVIEANGGRLLERFRKPAAYGGGESLRFRIMLGGLA